MNAVAADQERIGGIGRFQRYLPRPGLARQKIRHTLQNVRHAHACPVRHALGDQFADAADDFPRAAIVIHNVLQDLLQLFPLLKSGGCQINGDLRVIHDCAEGLMELVRERRRHLSHRRDARQMRQLVVRTRASASARRRHMRSSSSPTISASCTPKNHQAPNHQRAVHARRAAGRNSTIAPSGMRGLGHLPALQLPPVEHRRGRDELRGQITRRRAEGHATCQLRQAARVGFKAPHVATDNAQTQPELVHMEHRCVRHSRNVLEALDGIHVLVTVAHGLADHEHDGIARQLFEPNQQIGQRQVAEVLEFEAPPPLTRAAGALLSRCRRNCRDSHRRSRSRLVSGNSVCARSIVPP